MVWFSHHDKLCSRINSEMQFAFKKWQFRLQIFDILNLSCIICFCLPFFYFLTASLQLPSVNLTPVLSFSFCYFPLTLSIFWCLETKKTAKKYILKLRVTCYPILFATDFFIIVSMVKLFNKINQHIIFLLQKGFLLFLIKLFKQTRKNKKKCPANISIWNSAME